jgi:hypothetical protein
VATTREKYQRTHDPELKCQRCKRSPRIYKTKTGAFASPQSLMMGPEGRTFLKVCRLCRRVLEGYGWKLYGPNK